MTQSKKISAKNKAEKPVWLKYTEKEVKDIILNIIKKHPEMTSEKIGLVLRDTYGIPTAKIYKIKVSQVLKEAKAYKNPDLENIGKKVTKLEKHMEKNKKDQRTKRALTIAKSRLKKIKEYLIDLAEEI